jgi:TolB-like protein
VASFVIVLAGWGVVAAGWLLLSERPGEIAEAGLLAVATESKSIAVLPFENIGGVEENEAFTDRIHDDILTHLYKIGDLKPPARTSVLRYGDRRHRDGTTNRPRAAPAGWSFVYTTRYRRLSISASRSTGVNVT